MKWREKLPAFLRGGWTVFDPAIDAAIVRFYDKENTHENADIVKRDGQHFSCICELGGRKYFCKCHRTSGHLSRLKGAVYGYRAAVLRRNLLALRDSGLSVPRLVAAHVAPPLGPPSLFIAVYEWLEGGKTAHACLSGASAHSREQMTVKLTDSIVELHRLGFCHGDLKLNNLVIVEGTPYFVDVEHIGKVDGRKKKLADFSRFIAGLIEVGVDDGQLIRVLSRYADGMRVEKNTLYEQVRVNANKIISRHNEKYGKHYRMMPAYNIGDAE